MQINFDPVKHVYSLPGGEVIPSVTQIISPLHDFGMVPKDVMERARLFGNGVHKTVELYLLDELDEETLDPALTGCLNAFRLFLLDHPEFADATPIIETPGYHPRLKYAGTPDLEYEWAVVDLKSRAVNLVCDPLQLAAYDNFNGGDRDRYVLELRQDGTYVLTRIDRTMAARKQSWSRFRFLLDHYKNQQEIERWKK